MGLALGQHDMAASGLGCRSPWLGLGGQFLTSFAQMGLENKSSDHVYRASILFSPSVWMVIAQEPCVLKLVNKWVW